MPADESQRARVGMSWEQMERATIAAERDEYRRSRPGERVRRMLELIRRDRDRLQLRSLLVEGAGSAPTDPADAPYFRALRDRRPRGRGG